MQTDRLSAWEALSATVTFYSATCIVFCKRIVVLGTIVAQRACNAVYVFNRLPYNQSCWCHLYCNSNQPTSTTTNVVDDTAYYSASTSMHLVHPLRHITTYFLKFDLAFYPQCRTVKWVPAKRRWCSAAGKVTAGLAESNGSQPPGEWPAGWLAGWLPVHRDKLRAQRSVTSIGSLFYLRNPIFILSGDRDFKFGR